MENILPLVIFLGVFVLPIYVAVRAWRKGHREWTWATLASWISLPLIGIVASKYAPLMGAPAIVQIFAVAALLCPPIVSIIAWIKTKEHLAVPIECSKCGRPSKAIRRVTLNQPTGEIVSSIFTGTIWLISGIACVVLSIVLLVFGLTWKGSSDLPIGGVGLLFVVGISLIGIGRNILSKRPASLIKKIEYKCTACGYSFFQ